MANNNNGNAALGVLFVILLVLAYIATPIIVTVVYYRWSRYKTIMPFLVAFFFLIASGSIALSTTYGSVASYISVYLGCISLFWLVIWLILAIYKVIKFGKWKVQRQLYISGRYGSELLKQVRLFLVGMIVITPFIVISAFFPNVSQGILPFVWYFSLIAGSIVFGTFSFLKGIDVLTHNLKLPTAPSIEVITSKREWEH